MSATVSRLLVTPVKGIGLNDVERIVLEDSGAVGDRRFFLIDDRERVVNGKRFGSLQTVHGSFAPDDQALTLRLPGGETLEAEVRFDESSPERDFGRFCVGRLVEGPWDAALSALCGEPLRLVMTRSAVDRGADGAVSLVSDASLRRLAEQAGVDVVDSRRFRMLIELDGIAAHAEDDWVGQELRAGEALLRVEGHIGRCMVTSRDPDSGEVTLPTLDLLRSYRADLDATEPLPFGIHARVLSGGTVALGDPVELTH